jgi:hypothetical protein
LPFVNVAQQRFTPWASSSRHVVIDHP